MYATDGKGVLFIYHAAPTTERPIHRPMPRSAHTYGDIDSRKAPTYFEGEECGETATRSRYEMRSKV